ncbi:MAG: DUF4968 domain-containing protein [Prolixibacteraceae bacterium]|nr:DUF4968 domain-containing protein [Prolixibacteraceae bacterium]
MGKQKIIKKHIISISIVQSFLIALFLVLAQQVFAGTNGKYSTYRQVTDKEVVIESNKGVKVLFTAYSNRSIGVTYFTPNDKVSLILPAEVASMTDIKGSIYVEELEELIQITTTDRDGLLIKINRKPFGFSVYDKAGMKEMVLNDDFSGGLISKDMGKEYQFAEEKSIQPGTVNNM